MSKSMKIILGAFGGVVLVGVLLSMLGVVSLPLGPLNGMLAGDDDVVVDASETTIVDTNPSPSLGTQLCDPVTGLPIGGAGAGAAAGAGAGAGTGAGTGTTPGAAGAGATGTVTDPATSGATGTGTGTATDPSTGAPIAAPSGDGSGSARIIAAGEGGYDSSRIPDSWVVAADVVDPASTSGAVDPAATTGAATTGTTTDPTTGAPVDPATSGAAGAGATGTTGAGAAGAGAAGAAGAGAATGGVPCDQVSSAGAGAAGAGAGAGTTPGGTGAAGAGAGAGAAAGAAATAARATSDGTNNGNNPEALRAAKDASSVMQKAKITVSTTATLAPAGGGIGRPAALKRYRSSVTAATLVMRLDSAAMQQWTGAGKKVQTDLVKSFMTRLGKSYARAVRSVTIVDDQGNVLAIGDASAGGGVARVKLF